MAEILDEKMASLESDDKVFGSERTVSEKGDTAKKQERKDDLSGEADDEAIESEKNETDESSDGGKLVDDGDDLDDELNAPKGDVEDELNVSEGDVGGELDVPEGESGDELDVPKGDVGDELNVPEGDVGDEFDVPEQEFENEMDRAELELADDVNVLRAELAELSSLRSIDDLAHPEEYARFRSLGLTPREAYLATGERREPREQRRITAPMSVKRDRTTIPDYYLKMAREIFGGLSDREIQSLYKRVSRNS